MSGVPDAQDGLSSNDQRIEDSNARTYQIDEDQFANWQFRWNTREEVIDALLTELEHAMTQSQSVKVPTLRLVTDEECEEF